MVQPHILTKGPLIILQSFKLDGIALLHCVSCFSNKLYGPTVLYLYNLGFAVGFVLFCDSSVSIPYSFRNSRALRQNAGNLTAADVALPASPECCSFLSFQLIFLHFGNIHMEEKNALESAFEWICECGAFEQLRKQCEQYTKVFTVSLAPHLHPESSSLEW